MSEEKRRVSAKAVAIALVAINVLFFGYARFVLDKGSVASHIDDLQINPARIKLMNAATRGPGGSVPKSACLEWGPFNGVDAAKAEGALQQLSLRSTPVQRSLGESAGARRFAYYVREPDAGTVAQIAELQRSFPGTDIKAGPCPS